MKNDTKNNDDPPAKSEIHKRIMLFIEYIGSNPTAFAKKVGLSRDYLTKVSEPSPTKITMILDEYKSLSREWLLYGEGEMIKPPMSLIEPENAFKPYNARHVDLHSGKSNLTLVPLKAYGGFVTGYEHRVFLDSLEQIPFPWIKGPCWGFEVEGFSMYKKGDEDSLKPGDTVVCTELYEIQGLVRGKIYVFVTIDGICIKLFDRIENGKYHLKSANDEYNPVTPIPVKEVKKIYYKERILK